METQTFIIEVELPDQKDAYIIKRRYSDFLFLYEIISCNHLGYILETFPKKTVDSFINIKFSLSGQERKIELIQKRMLLLEKFTNWVLRHEYLRNSDEIQFFIEEKESKY